MTMQAASLAALLGRLIQEAKVITFYDALGVINSARAWGDLDQPGVGALMALHDAPHTTDGARGLLAEYLRGVAKRQAQQRDLARRPLGLGDRGKVVRAAVGSTVRLQFGEREALGWRWEITLQEGPIHGTREASEAAGEGLARFALATLAPGHAQVQLEERPDAVPWRRPAARQREVKPRRFSVRVIVEAD